jgi:hypothetical protein
MSARRPPRPSLEELVRSSSFIFAGTVVEAGRSNVRVVEPQPNLLLVRIDRPIRVDAALGDVQERVVTLDAQDHASLPVGTKAVFLAQSWIHGEELALHEVAHVGLDQLDGVVAAVAELPELHLAERASGADLVVHAEVERTHKLDLPLERRAPEWSEASLRVESTIKGRARGLRLLFPTSLSHHWYRAPRFRRGQRGIFILRENDPQAGRWLGDVDGRVMTALDPADFQPEAAAGRIRSLIRATSR